MIRGISQNISRAECNLWKETSSSLKNMVWNDKVWITHTLNLIRKGWLWSVKGWVLFVKGWAWKELTWRAEPSILQGNIFSQRKSSFSQKKLQLRWVFFFSFVCVSKLYFRWRSFEFHWQRRISFSTLISMWYPVRLASFLLDESLIEFRVALSMLPLGIRRKRLSFKLQVFPSNRRCRIHLWQPGIQTLLFTLCHACTFVFLRNDSPRESFFA